MQQRPIPFLRIYLLVLRMRRRMYLSVLTIVTIMSMLAHGVGSHLFGTPYRSSGFASFWLTAVAFFWLADISVWYMIWLRETSRRHDGLP